MVGGHLSLGLPDSSTDALPLQEQISEERTEGYLGVRAGSLGPFSCGMIKGTVVTALDP